MKRDLFTIGQIAERFGVPTWQVRRLFQRDLLPPAKRLGVYRVFGEEDLTAIEAALDKAGYIARSEATTTTGA